MQIDHQRPTAVLLEIARSRANRTSTCVRGWSLVFRKCNRVQSAFEIRSFIWSACQSQIASNLKTIVSAARFFNTEFWNLDQAALKIWELFWKPIDQPHNPGSTARIHIEHTQEIFAFRKPGITRILNKSLFNYVEPI